MLTNRLTYGMRNWVKWPQVKCWSQVEWNFFTLFNNEIVKSHSILQLFKSWSLYTPHAQRIYLPVSFHQDLCQLLQRETCNPVKKPKYMLSLKGYGWKQILSVLISFVRALLEIYLDDSLLEKLESHPMLHHVALLHWLLHDVCVQFTKCFKRAFRKTQGKPCSLNRTWKKKKLEQKNNCYWKIIDQQGF